MTALIFNLGSLLAIMAALSLIEIIIPLFKPIANRYRHQRVNLALMLVMLVTNFILNFALVVTLDTFAGINFGLLNVIQLSYLMVVLIAIIVLDFATYLAHVIFHKVPLFWRCHRVHHSDPFVDASTSFRQHPIESILRFIFIALPAVALGLPIEAILLYRSLSAFNAILEHSNIKLPGNLDKLISVIWVTPNMHKLHHSNQQQQTDSNYGNLFSVFDRIFKTFTPTTRVQAVIYGLENYDIQNKQTLRALLTLPFSASTNRSKIINSKA